MIKVKDIKEHYVCTACNTLASTYNIYSKTRDGKRSNGLYLGYVNVCNSRATHFPTNTIVKDIDELDRVANEWADNAEYEPITYCPDCRKSYVAELRIHDHLVDLGFKQNRLSNSYSVDLSNIGTHGGLTLFLEIDDRLNDDFSISLTVKTGVDSWIDLSGNDYEKVIENIDSFMRLIMLNTMCSSLNIYNKVGTADVGNIDGMLMKKVVNYIDVKATSFKDYLINTLEDTLKTLKNE